VGWYTCIRLHDEMLADLNGSRTNKVGETVARTVIGTQAPTKSRVFTGTHNSRWIAGPPHIGLGLAMGHWHNIDPTTLTRGEGEGGCLDLWGIPLRHIVSAILLHCFFVQLPACSDVMHVTQSQLHYAHARTYECARSMIRKRRYGASTHGRGLTRATVCLFSSSPRQG
jgi:hypothetical protein